MARDTRTLTDLAGTAWHALLAVSAALPLPEDAVAGVTEIQASPAEQHLMALREIAFSAILDELLAGGYAVLPEDLDALGRGEIPARDYEAA